MKCELCGKKIEETFLKKFVGTYVKNKKGKRKPVCPICQAKFTTKEIKAKLG